MTKYFLPLILASLILASCSPPLPGTKKVVEFSDESDDTALSTPTPFSDSLSGETINITETKKLNSEFKVKYKTIDPSGEGYADFKAISFAPIDKIGDVVADSGKKLYLLKLAVHGNTQNKGQPSTFNQIGDTPSPQFVLIDKAKNTSFVEETYFSDSYTVENDLFELSKLTLDGEQWVTTAIVFQIDDTIKPDLAFRFTNIEGQTEFYDITE